MTTHLTRDLFVDEWTGGRCVVVSMLDLLVLGVCSIAVRYVCFVCGYLITVWFKWDYVVYMFVLDCDWD